MSVDGILKRKLYAEARRRQRGSDDGTRSTRRTAMSWSRKVRTLALAAIGTAMAMSLPALAPVADAKTLRFAFQGELKSVDPYQINESFSLSVNGAVYEGLVRFRPDLTLEPSLATSWEVLDPLHWRFHLRKDVKFHEGQDF